MMKFASIFLSLLILFSCVKEEPNLGAGDGKIDHQINNRYAMVYTPVDTVWNTWKFASAKAEGTFSNLASGEWDKWDVSTSGVSGSFNTIGNENWDSWVGEFNGEYTLFSTYQPNDFRDWTITNQATGMYVSVFCVDTVDFSEWVVFKGNNHLFDVIMDYSMDFSRWSIYQVAASTGDLYLGQEIALQFIPVFVGALKNRGLIP